MKIRAVLGFIQRHLVRIVAIGVLVGVVCAGGLLAFLEWARSQEVVLPSPTGSYAVGRVAYDWVDATREDSLAPVKGQKREVLVWVWYPTQVVSDSPPAPYLPQRWAQAIDADRGAIGTLLTQNWDMVQDHSMVAPPVATTQPRYPVLVFEPGMGNIPAYYTTLIEDLASHGYIVVGITPTYSASVVVFPDGREVTASPAGKLPENGSDAELKQAGDKLIQVWAADVRFVLDKLESLNAEPGGTFAGKLDLDRVGVFGHSFGGATAAEVCHLDRRCKVGMDIDGELFGAVMQTGLDQPFMFLMSDPPPVCPADCQQTARDIQQFYNRLPNAKKLITLHGAYHFNFSDYAVIFAPVLKPLGVLGPIDGTLGLQETRDDVRDFFDTYLR